MNNQIKKALQFAFDKHIDQERNNGLPYIGHPLVVLWRLAAWGINDTSIWQTAILHDTVEDTDTTQEELVREFGEQVASWVGDLTFRSKRSDENPWDYQKAKSAHLADFVHKPVEVLVVKLSDRICNVEDFLTSSSPDYANKYLTKASGLFDAFADRKEDIDERFGKKVFALIQDDYQRVKLSTSGRSRCLHAIPE